MSIQEYLDGLPDDVTKINMDSRNLTGVLPDLSRFTNLKNLSCSYNHLTSLSRLPNSLTRLACHNNYLTSLPKLPDDLRILVCDSNNLTILPRLPERLESLACHDNNLTSLPKLPDSLRALMCNNNNLTSLPKLPDSLRFLICSNNRLTSLTKLPDRLRVLMCDNNNLTSLPRLPDSLRNHLGFHNNPVYQTLGRYTIAQIKQLQKVSHTVHSLKHKNKFNRWFMASQKNKIETLTHPDKLDRLVRPPFLNPKNVIFSKRNKRRNSKNEIMVEDEDEEANEETLNKRDKLYSKAHEKLSATVRYPNIGQTRKKHSPIEQFEDKDGALEHFRKNEERLMHNEDSRTRRVSIGLNKPHAKTH